MSIGLDIGTKSIKAVELKKAGSKFTLKSAGVVGFKGFNIDAVHSEKDEANLVAVVKKLLKDIKVSSKKVSVALPEAKTYTRVIKFPMLTDQEIASAINWEAEQYIPIPINEAIVQHTIVERNENTTPPYVLSLLVAVPRVISEKYVGLLSKAGLTVVGAETELMSIVRSISNPKGTSIILDFGATSTDLAISRNSQLMFSRSIPTAGEALTRAVAQTLGISVAQAEQYKTTYGLRANQLEGKVAAALSPVMKVLVDEIKKAIQFYKSEQQSEVPTNVILSGGSAGLGDMIPYMTKNLGMEVAIGNPFSKITVDPKILKNLAAYSPLYSIAVGLAMREE